ncbi:MAG: hypothetical protein DRI22_03350, partial [Caldiserica bacterium]
MKKLKEEFMKRFLFIVFLFSSFLFSQDESPVAVLDDFSGRVLVYVSKDKKWVGAKKGMELTENDSINTYDGNATIFLIDGSKIFIKENSILNLRTITGGKREFDLFIGKVRAKVKELLPGAKFIIYTPQAVCSVRGTDFEVEVFEDEKTKVKVYDGIVGVMDSEKLGKEVLVKKGEETLVVRGKPVFPAKPIEEKIEKKPEKKKVEKKEVEKEVVEVPEFEEKREERKEKKRKPSTAKAFKMYGNLGAVALTDPETGETKVYYQLSLLPEFKIGKLGIGLDLVFYFDENNNLRKGDWTWKKAWEKIAYIRWGEKYKDPLYLLLGRFTRPVSIGNGSIVNNYSNMIQYPEVKRLGFEFALDRNSWGIEGVISDISTAHKLRDLKSSGFWAGRVYFRPLINTGIPLFNKLVLGGTYATDIEPDGIVDEKDDSVSVYGIDAGIPVLNTALLRINLFSDFAMMDLGDSYIEDPNLNIVDKGKGFVYGIGGNILFLKYRFEYRTIENNFIPGYFDTYYDIDRYRYYSEIKSTTTKAASYLDGKTREPILKGPLFRAGFNIMNGMITFSATYENYNVKPDDPYYPHLYAIAKVDKRVLLNQYQVEFIYDKRNIHTWKDLSRIKGP